MIKEKILSFINNPKLKHISETIYIVIFCLYFYNVCSSDRIIGFSFVTNISKRGSDIVKTYSYDMDNLSLRFSEAVKEKNVSLEVSYNESEKKNILVDHGTWAAAFPENG